MSLGLLPEHKNKVPSCAISQKQQKTWVFLFGNSGIIGSNESTEVQKAVS